MKLEPPKSLFVYWKSDSLKIYIFISEVLKEKWLPTWAIGETAKPENENYF
jgi:hypothetical protein